jgi:uncharacterized protein YjiS (DUF1127 family)
MRFLRQWSVHAMAAPTKVRSDLAAINLKACGRWFNLMTAGLTELWSRMARQREMRRRRAAWATIDDRTLKDIGVSRWEVAYAEFGQRRAADMDIAQLRDRKMSRASFVPGPQLRAAFPECPVL